MKTRTLVAGLAGLMALATTAAAEPSGANKAAAEALFNQGKRLMADKNYAEACPKFQASQELDPGVGSLLFLGDCFEKSGKTASAWATFKEAQGLAQREQDPGREKVASVRALALKPRLSMLLVRVDAALMGLEGLDIHLNGHPVPKAQWGSRVPVDPGPQRVEATAPGFERYDQTLNIASGPTSSTLDIPSLKPTKQEAPPPPAPEPTPKAAQQTVTVADAPRSNTQKTIGIVLGGVGILGTGVGSYFGLRAIGKNSDSDDKCRTATQCSPEGLTLRNQARDAAKVSTIAFSAGAALLGTGLVLFLAADDTRAAHGASSLFLTAGVVPSGTSLELGGVW